ncbi:hypothetical protein PVAP13_3NG123701 [Panicum virgatum]|uniref:Uncharacterized protein n=1 Tax=Panicum virgatum TaxID=38727 RepID=A0A8T0UGG1_PANVG|nr:hypothetical protein PVAP13_3NG123701 [Panicum virgatum]
MATGQASTALEASRLEDHANSQVWCQVPVVEGGLISTGTTPHPEPPVILLELQRIKGAKSSACSESSSSVSARRCKLQAKHQKSEGRRTIAAGG